MKYSDLSDANDFFRNMRTTPWLKLFPHWYSEKDVLLNAIGDEVERIKAQAIFTLLNSQIKPPCLVWQNSLIHKEYHVTDNITQLPSVTQVQAPLYKTWGKITLTNNTVEDIDTLAVMITQSDGFVITQSITQSDKIVIDLIENKVTLNNKKIKPQKIGEGIPYFKTVQNNDEHVNNTPLHNEAIKVKVKTEEDIECDIDIDIELKDAVFTNEQNIEVTGLELVPIEKVELYVKYDFEYNKKENGWHKVYEKEYEANTNVLYDMITKQYYTKEFYVNVWYKTLQFPYQVGFPCYKDAEESSMYHVNTHLDTWGEQLGLERRLYKTDIDEKVYAKTFPPYYPADIEQDYWYYKRLSNEYTWNDLAINDVDLKDTEGNNIIRLYSINPFVEDFVVHAKSTYTSDKEYVNFNKYIPKLVTQRSSDNNKRTQQTPFTNTRNVLKYDNNKTNVQLTNKSGLNVNNLKYMSKELLTYFDLSDLPNDINIDNIEVLVEAESTDSKVDKHSNDKTGIIIPSLYKDGDTTFIPLTADKDYQLSEQTITYSNKDIKKYINKNNIKFAINNIKYTESTSTLHIPIKITRNDNISIWRKVLLKIGEKEFKGIYDQKTEEITVTIGFDDINNNNNFEITCYHNINDESTPSSTIINIEKDKIFTKDKNKDIIFNASIKKQTYDKEIKQSAKIGIFKDVKLGTLLRIPFNLSENNSNNNIESNELISDIYQVWLYFDDRLIEGKYNDGYIEAPVPSNQITKQITIVCKSRTHAPFTTTIDVATKKNESDNPNEEYLYIEGPLVNNTPSDILIDDTWHTSDFRTRLQREGLYFRNILENDNIYSSTSINIKNIVLKVSYSPKKTHFNLYTTINKKVTGNKIGEYNVYIKNTGEKRLQTYIDIINAPNIRLSENIIDVELDIGEKLTKTIDIYKQLPIDDGFYDILAVCEDVTCKDIIEVSSQGLIQTGINLKYHHAKYNQENTLTATLTTGDLSTINSDINNLSFYINGYLIGTTNVIDNKATLKFTPSENGFLKTGILDLEVKYSGTIKYAASHKKNTIFISKDKTNIQINVSDIALYKQEYNIPVEVFDDNEGNVVNGKVNYYFDDIYLGEATAGLDKQFTLNIANLDIKPGKYTLYARYIGDNNYSVSEESKEITIIGGDVNLYIDDINALPTDEKTLEVKVLDDEYNLVPSGYIYFDIDDLNIHIADIEVKNGKASSLLQLNNAPVGTYPIKVTYQNSKITGYSNTTTTAILIIEKRKVNIERYAPYQGSQYEPLGFLFKVTDAITGDLINSGKIKLEVVSTNWDIPSVDIKDGYARIIHNPVTMTAKEWESLSNYQFFIGKEYPSRIINNITGEQVNVQDIDGFDINTYNSIVTRLDDLFGIWSGDGGFPEQENYFELVDGYLYYHSSSVDEDDDISEFLVIDNEGHLHQQTSDTHRKYDIKDYNLKLKFYDSPQYKDKTVVIEEGLHIDNNYDIDLDILLYNDLTYSSTTDTICYVTNTLTHENITSGQVIFKLDNQIFYTANVENGIAKIPTIKYFEIEKGNYLLEALYQKNSIETTHTYAHYSMGQIKPLISCNDFNKDRGQKSTVKVNLQTTGNTNIGLLSGFVNAYLDGQLLNSLYLYGNEEYIGIINDEEDGSTGIEKITDVNDIEFIIDIPDDVDEHNLTIVYEGNDLIESISKSIDFVPAPAKVTLSCNPSKMAKGQPGIVEIFAIAKDYIINEGYINILDSNEKIVAHGNIRGNKATLKWTPIEGQYYRAVFGGSRLYECDNEYQIVSSDYYKELSKNDKDIALIIDIIGAVDYINLTKKPEYGEQPEYGTLQTAVQCLSDDGEIFIEEDYIISESVTINKNINIYGSNGAALIKDLPNLKDLSNVKIYATSDNLYEIEGLTQYQLNEKDFTIQDGDIYTLKDYNKLYLMSDGKFYSEKELKLQDILTDVIITITGDASVNIDNLVFKSNDKDLNKYKIDNIGNLKITHSIIEESVKISSSGFLRVNNSLVYGRISSSNYNLDNNWWGSNNPPHKVNNNIILTLETAEYPPVISEDINIVGKLIGANDRHYDIPDADFILEADTGYFGIDSGKMINGEISTSYMDATAENPVTITVDNQSVSTQIYDYARKTEIIIDSIPEIPYGYYVPINAEIRSCADSYFDLDREIDGYINFFLDNKQVGHVPIKNNIATLVLYSKYDIGNEYELKAIYEPKEYYFKSESLLKFNIIDDTDVVYVSSSGGNDYGDGSFDSPFKTIQKALTTQNHTIYLKDKNYQESELNISKSVTIKSYCNNVVFKNIEGSYVFNTNNNRLTLSNIDFIDNLTNTLFSNNSIITAQYCTFVNNKQLFTTSDNIIILYSAIINNDSISDTIKPQNFQYCWFGTNTPRTDINPNINNYIIMKIDATKKEENEIILYNGIVTRLTATLRHYKQHINNNEFEYSLSEDIPLRIANFISDDFLFLPKKDYTYHNYATSLLDTNKQSDNDTIKLKISGTTQYINNNVEIICQVTNQLNEQLNDGFVNFLIRYNDKIYANENIRVENGEAVLKTNPLRKGEYVLECTYNGYVKSATLIVKKEDLWVQSLNISDSDNAYNLSIDGIFGNSSSKNINNEDVNILIDDILIDTCKINNNSISKVINYPMLKAGKHSLEIVYDGEKYDEYNYLTYFTSKEKETEITFNYDFIEAGTVNYLDIYINDNEKPVTKGNIDVYFDNNKYYSQNIKTIQCKDITNLNSYILLTTEDLINNKLYKNNNKIKVSILNNNTEVYYREFNINNNKLISTDNDEYITYPIGNIDIENVSEQNSQSLIVVSFDIPYHDIMIEKELNTHSLRVSIEGYDIEKSHIVKNAEITNGYYQLSIPIIHNTDIKQHSIFIIYSGYSGYYKESTRNKDNISSGIFGIKSDLPDIVYADIDAPFNIDSKIIDMNGQPVFRGSVDVYINDILVLNDIDISNSHIIASAALPNGIKPGKHSLRIEYTDDTDIYLDTIIQRELQIRSLDTAISLKSFNAYPNEEVTIEYEVTSNYGNVNEGVITFNINDVIYSKEVSDGLFNQITFKAPNLPADIYDMTVSYKDKDNTYNESSLETQFILNKNTLNIEPSHTWYYPKKSFIFTATFTNNDGARANSGFASIYIDGVKEKENIKVINGQASTYLEFDNVKKYEITIIYEENDYHEKSSYTYDFFTNTIPINNITFDYNNSKINTVIFETKDNINVYDGVLDIKIDDEYVKTIFITENNKALDLDISNLSKGKHEVNVKYYDSSMFDNYEGIVDIYIEPKTLGISIKEEEKIYAQIDNYINVPIELTDIISGTVKYYINNDMYIGMSNIQNDNKANFKFKVPISFTDKTYNITAKFIGNEFYNESISNTATLFIQKHESHIRINNEKDIEAFYQENINLNIDTNIEGNLSVFLKIYDKNNEIVSSDNLLISQDNDTTYQLNSHLIEGKYTISIYYPGSVYYKECSTSCKLIILPYTPLINKNDIYSETNIGGVITLNSLVKNINDVPIFDVGNFRYVIDKIGYDNEVELNNTINIDVENQEVDKILCYYVSDDHTKYLDAEIEINATYIKNELNARIIDSREDLYILKEASDSNGNINLSTSTISSAIHNKDTNFIKSLTLEDDKIISDSITQDSNKTISSNLEDAITNIQLNNESNIEYNYVKDVYDVNNRMSVDMLNISRGGQYEWSIFAESLTTSIIPNDIPYTIYVEQENENITLYSGTIENGESKAIIDIPITLSYQDQYKIIFTTEETSVFEAFTKEVIVNNNNQDIIYVDPEAETDTINTVKTLSNAVELVRDNGIINIKNDITENNEIEINKNITIESDKKTLTNCSIINNAELDIDNVIFDNTLASTNAKSFIVNNNSTRITSCIFKNNKKSAIYSNKILEIYDAEFINNTAQSGSCIYINNKNYNTVVKRCKFNENNAQNYGSCIYSDKGNDLNISYSSFTNNNASNYTGQCICVTGNIYIYSVYFYNNMGESEIRLNDGVLEIDKSLFDNKIKPITINNGLLKANTNYWGTNNVEEDIIMNPEVNLKIDSWVNASYNVEEDESEYRINVLVNEYINTSEKEIKTIENLNDNFPIKINGESTTLNSTMTIPKPVDEIIVKVGSTREKVV